MKFDTFSLMIAATLVFSATFVQDALADPINVPGNINDHELPGMTYNLPAGDFYPDDYVT